MGREKQAMSIHGRDNGARIAAALALLAGPLGLAGCDKEAKEPDIEPREDYAETTELQPDAEGVYQLALQPSEVEINGQRYCLRTYNGALPGPTIRVPAGTDRRVRVNLENRFSAEDWREVSGQEGHEEPSCHDFNSTNLYFHGGHVQPEYATADASDPCEGEGCGEDGRYYGDNVLIEVAQGERAQYRWDIDEDGGHHEGTDWYHPHIHGATAIQVLNGAAGALIVEGPVDEIPAVAAAKERIMMINEIPYNHETTVPLAEGESCTEATLSINNFLAATEGMPILVNGVTQPTLTTTVGQVERWRMIYAGTPDEMAMKLHPATSDDCSSYDTSTLHTFTQYARDGITLPQYFESDTVWVSPGYRVDSFMQMPDTAQTLCLVGRRTHDLEGSVIAVIKVEAGEPTSTDFPAEADVAATAPPVTWTGRVDGVEQQVTCESVNTIHQRVGLLMPPVAAPSSSQLSDGGECTPEDHGTIDPDAEVCECPSPNINCRRFETRRAWGYRSDRVAVVGDTEKWEIVAFDGHPFHIHINPFLVCENNSNKEPNFPHWRDTFWVQAEDGPREVLMNFKTYSGNFVTHCHKLNHEDEGMMELVELCAEDDLDCQCQRFDGGECVSQAGCRQDDLQSQFAEQVTWNYPAPVVDPLLCGP